MTKDKEKIEKGTVVLKGLSWRGIPVRLTVTKILGEMVTLTLEQAIEFKFRRENKLEYEQIKVVKVPIAELNKLKGL